MSENIKVQRLKPCQHHSRISVANVSASRPFGCVRIPKHERSFDPRNVLDSFRAFPDGKEKHKQNDGGPEVAVDNKLLLGWVIPWEGWR